VHAAANRGGGMKLAAAGVLALVCAGSPALAGGAAGTAGANGAAGYFEIHGGVDCGFDDYYSHGAYGSSDYWRRENIGGAARGSVALGTQASIQGDLWVNRYGTTMQNYWYGGALHLTLHPTERDQLGVLASLGAQDNYDYTLYSLSRVYLTNFAVEWAHNADKWRLYAQGGYASNIGNMAFIQGWDPQWREIPFNNAYGVIAATYFFQPNLALSAKFGVDKFTSSINWVDNNYELQWGAKLEFRQDNWPVIAFLAYKGRSEKFDYQGDVFTGNGVENVVLAGLKVPFQTGTIQSLYDQVGLADLNPTFGDFTY
jgi:hypothetical protein